MDITREHWKQNLTLFNILIIMGCVSVSSLAFAEKQVTKRTTVTTITTTESDEDTADYDTSDDINFDININKEFRAHENVEGEIVVTNTSTVSLPATFHVRIFHNDNLFKDLEVTMREDVNPISPGVTKYTLEEFGIPDLNKNVNYGGTWVVAIDQGEPGKSKEASFKVNSVI